MTGIPDFESDAARGQKLILEWTTLEDGARALIFDAATWAAFEKTAQAQGKTADQIITTAVAASLGTILADNFALNRWLKHDNPDFFKQRRRL